MFRKIILTIVFATLYVGNAQVHAELTLRTFSVDVLSSNIRSASNANFDMAFTPIYGGSDRSAFRLSWGTNHDSDRADPNNSADVPILEFDVPENIQVGDELVGLVMTERRGIRAGPEIPPPQILLSGDTASPVVLPIVDFINMREVRLKPFRIPLPTGSASNDFRPDAGSEVPLSAALRHNQKTKTIRTLRGS